MSENLNELRLEGFLETLQPDRGQLLESIRARALADGVPIIRSETESLLRFLIMTRKPRKILEVGCAVGYSALIMRQAAESYGGCHITTMESYEPRVAQACENFAAAGAQQEAGSGEKIASKLIHSGQKAAPGRPRGHDSSLQKSGLERVVQLLDGGQDIVRLTFCGVDHGLVGLA